MEPVPTKKLARKLGLHILSPKALTIRRKRAGEGWEYYNSRNRGLSDQRVIARLKGLAVPPAYEDVLYASDPKAHLQAVGRDSAGRLQYRYHPDWEKVREIRKAQRLMNLIECLPRIRRAISSVLNEGVPNREFALAAVIELVAITAIRAGNEEYAQEHKTRGATTLLKSNVRCEGDRVTLRFRAKGGKQVHKEFRHARLCQMIGCLAKLPGRRLFQFQDVAGDIRAITSHDVNAYLREIAGCETTLKDFRTLCATAEVLESLASVEPAATVTGRKRQITQALSEAAQSLENTPAVCRKSYVHPAVLTAFETGTLKSFSNALKSARSSACSHNAVAEVIVAAAAM
jgi:DNA topoisomerase I